MFCNESEYFAQRNFFCIETIDIHAHRILDADDIRKLYFTLFGQSACNDMFGEIPCHIRSASIYLGAILAGIRTSAMFSSASIRIHDIFPSGESGVGLRSSYSEHSCRINEDFGFLVHPFSKHGSNDVLDDGFMQFFLVCVFFMLCRDNDSMDSHLFLIMIFHRDLCLAVRIE